MPSAHSRDPWGTPPWRIDFEPPQKNIPSKVDFAVIGGGFTGLAAAAWLRLLDPHKSVVLFESGRIGAGASGRTGGMALAESAAGDLPGLGDVLAGLKNILDKLGHAAGGASLADVCELDLRGAWEVGRKGPGAGFPIHWNDSGDLRVIDEVPGGTLDPGKLVSGLGASAVRLGAIIAEDSPVTNVRWSDSGAELEFTTADSSQRKVAAGKVLFATNGLSLELSGFNLDSPPPPMLAAAIAPRLTLAAATAPLAEDQIKAIGLDQRKPFYTVDLPYLWGRLCNNNAIVWGAGLVSPANSNDLRTVDISADEPAKMFATLEKRVRGLHPALANLQFTHRWGGPILIGKDWLPVFRHHSQSCHGIILGAYSGHGVALSSYLGAWAAEAILGRRELPNWEAN